MRLPLYSAILRIRNGHLFAFDLLLMCLTPTLSLWLRVESYSYFQTYLSALMTYTVVSMAWKILFFYLFGLYQRYWRLASIDDCALLCYSTSLSWAFGIVVYLGVLNPLQILPVGLPKSVPIIDGLLTMLFIGGSRLSLRLVFELNERIRKKKHEGKSSRILIAGAGVAGSVILKEIRTNPILKMEPIGFVDDDPTKLGVFLHGLPVLGMLEDVPNIIAAHSIDEVIIAMPTAPGDAIRAVVKECIAAGVKNRTVPGIFEILGGSAIAQLREVKIEDLLRRGMVKTDTTRVEMLIKGSTVMVTGAGGSIGSEMCRQICAFHPAELILLGHGENSIFEMAKGLQRDFASKIQSMRLRTIIADIRDEERMEQIFQSYRPQIVFHAAAHKHVGLMEVNLADAVTNNVRGTRLLVNLAGKYDVQRFVMISSDKAVNPTCVMGVTKRVAELVVHEAADKFRKPFVTVRFGNVLGSRGSVVPIFQKQIARGGPVTITHPDVERFFMTIPEAVELVLQAGTMGNGGERFVLDMGKPIKIVDLANDLIRLSGLRPGVDVNIQFTGLLRGEKMKEELFYDFEKIEKSGHDYIFVNRYDLRKASDAPVRTSSRITTSFVESEVENLILAARHGDIENMKYLLKSIVPEYQPMDEALPQVLNQPSKQQTYEELHRAKVAVNS